MSSIEHAAADQTLNCYFGAPDSDERNGSKSGFSGGNWLQIPDTAKHVE
jgi:hypothetical protein